MTKEALEICNKCREKQRNENPQSINCAFMIYTVESKVMWQNG